MFILYNWIKFCILSFFFKYNYSKSFILILNKINVSKDKYTSKFNWIWVLYILKNVYLDMQIFDISILDVRHCYVIFLDIWPFHCLYFDFVIIYFLAYNFGMLIILDI